MISHGFHMDDTETVSLLLEPHGTNWQTKTAMMSYCGSGDVTTLKGHVKVFPFLQNIFLKETLIVKRRRTRTTSKKYDVYTQEFGFEYQISDDFIILCMKDVPYVYFHRPTHVHAYCLVTSVHVPRNTYFVFKRCTRCVCVWVWM